MRAPVLVLVLVATTACAGHKAGPTLRAFSDADGVLHVEGTNWHRCTPVDLKLPKPWADSRKQVDEDGAISVLYAHPLVKPYRGRVTATQAACSGFGALDAATEIRVGDPRG